MHRIFTAIAALSLVLGLLLGFAGPASAVVAGYDSSYFGESAFLNLSAGQNGQFAVGFNNTGSTGWVKGSGSQVDLQVCLADKVTCGVASPNAAWASNWLSSTAYATATTDFVGPGQTGWFVYNITAPTSSAGTTARFNGDLALHATGQQVHPQGYYQDAKVAGTTPPPGGGGGGSIPSAVTSVTAGNLREITVKFNTAMAQSGTGDFTDPAHYSLSSNLIIDGARATDAQTVILTVGKAVASTQTPVARTGLAGKDHFTADPATYMSQNGTYTLTVTDAATAAFATTGTSTTTFTVQDSISPTATLGPVIGSYSFLIYFSEPMDPTSTMNGLRFDSQAICVTATGSDCNSQANTTFPTNNTLADRNGGAAFADAGTGLTVGANGAGIGNLHWQDRTGDDCASGSLNGGCFQVLRVDFDKRSGPLPSSGTHTVDIKDANDAAGNKIAPNPTSFTVTLTASSDLTTPTVSSANISVSGNLFRLDVSFSEAMAHTWNGYTTSASIDCHTCGGTSGTNYILRNPDGSAATTGGSSGSGTPIYVTNVQPGTDGQLSTGSAARFKLSRARLQLGPVGPDSGSGATTTPTLRPNTNYTVEVVGVTDEAGNALAPGTVKTFSWAGDSAAPTAPRAFLSTTTLRVDYSELMSSSTINATSGTLAPTNTFKGSTNGADKTRYSSPNSAFQTSLASMSAVGDRDNDDDGFTFTFGTPLAPGTYELDITGVVDPFGNLISPNPTIIQVTVAATAKPKLLCAGLGLAPNCANTVTNAQASATTTTSVSVRYSTQMQGGVSGANSAGNPSNYSVDNGTFGSLCSAGSPTITGGPVASDGSQVFTITCSGTAVWSAVGTHTLTAANVQDLSGNTIDPNPSTASFTQ